MSSTKITDVKNVNMKIVGVEITEMKTEKTEKLFWRSDNRRCIFFKPIKYEGKEIELRLDWNFNINNDPTLDAQIYRWEKGKRIQIAKEKWHHTRREYNKDYDRCVYHFKYKNLELHLLTKQTVGINITVDTIIVKDKVEAVKKEKIVK